jgi:hypothetical protein
MRSQRAYASPTRYLYNMQIRFKKNAGKLHSLSYTRDDGTITWMQGDDFLVSHDLTHYVIESTLHYTTAFNGMLNNGMNLKDFEDKEKRDRLTVTAEAVYAENFANLFLVEVSQGVFEDFNAVQLGAFISFSKQYEPVTLPPEKIESIRSYLRELLQRWKELPVGDTLVLDFIQ